MIPIKVSVIIPIYNAEITLPKCLDSFMDQTFSGWELILVDDGSRDCSGKICDEYAKRCAELSDGRGKISVLHRENGGVSAARQTGLDQAKGEYVIHADPDDWVEATMLEDLYEKAKAEDADMVICDFITDVNGKPIYKLQKPTSFDHEDVLNDIFTSKVHGSCCNKLVKREFILNCNAHFPSGINYCEDVCFNTQLLKHNMTIVYIAKGYYHYVKNAVSITNNYTKKTFENQKRFVDFLSTQLPPDSNAIIKSKLLVKKLAFRHSILTNKEFKKLYPEIKTTDDKKFLLKWMYNMAFKGQLNIAKGLLNGYHLFQKLRNTNKLNT